MIRNPMIKNRIITALAVLLCATFAGTTAAQAGDAPQPAANYSSVPGGPSSGDDFGGQITAATPYWANGSQFYRRTICIDTGWAPYFPYLDQTAADWRRASNNLLIIHVRKALQGCAASGFVESQRVFFRTYKADDGNCAYAQRYLQGSNNSLLAKAEIFINLQAGAGYEACRTVDQYRWVANHELGHILGLSHVPAAETPSVMNNTAPRTSKPYEGPYDGPRVRSIYGNNPA